MSSSTERRKRSEEPDVRTAFLTEQARQNLREQQKVIKLKTLLEKEKESANMARREAEKAKEEHMCTVCQDEEASMVLLNCGHLCLCPGCCDQIMSTQTRTCPICRVQIRSTVRTYRG
ncbi:hypothetical protein FRC02_008709 [Tulasnella sp. 418]|nr:hypothetical protein FRC02_008709 [Tulasnella sp. 418]